VYRVDVSAIPEAVQFRAELRASWPRIYGNEHGVVDGEADSDYAQLDDQGRYLVRFGFDESDLGAGKASTRVRMMQPHGGGVEGWHFPLRKGTEVLFTVLGGDPDRPVIAGVVPNAHTPSPVNKANHTRNVIQTGGRNRIEMEDRKGFERMTLSTPHTNTMIRMGSPNADHEMIIRTDGATMLDAGQDWDVNVGVNHTEYVAAVTDQTYQGNHTTQSWSKRTVEIGGAYVQNCHSNVTRKVNGSAYTTVDGSHAVTVGGGELYEVKVAAVRTVGANATFNVGGTETHTVAGAVTQSYGSLSLTSKGPVKIDAPSVTVNTPDWNVVTPDEDWSIAKAMRVIGNHTEIKSVSVQGTASLNEGFGMHVEVTGLHHETTATSMETVGTHIANEVVTNNRGGLNIITFGLIKIG